MGNLRDVTLTDEPQLVADSQDDLEAKTFVIVNVSGRGGGEWLTDGKALGEGIPIEPRERITATMRDRLHAAAPDTAGVVLRVLELRG